MASISRDSGIYIIRNTVNGKIYIGQAVNFNNRWNEHRKELKGQYHHNAHLQAAWNKYGDKAFQFKILERCSVDQLNEREQHYLDIHLPKGTCYNDALHANSPMRGRKHTEETKLKISRSGKGKIPVNKGIPASEETRQKLSDMRKGEGNHFFGKTHSDETRAKIGNAKRGHIPSEETRRKMSEAHKGKIPTQETRQKLREAMERRLAKKPELEK